MKCNAFVFPQFFTEKQLCLPPDRSLLPGKEVPALRKGVKRSSVLNEGKASRGEGNRSLSSPGEMGRLRLINTSGITPSGSGMAKCGLRPPGELFSVVNGEFPLLIVTMGD